MADNDQSIHTLRYNQIEEQLEGFGGGTPQWTPLDLSGQDTGITQLTGDVTAGPGSGSQVATLADGVVTAAKIDSEAATVGQVLTADGAGAATWEDGSTAAASGPAGAIQLSDGAGVFTNDPMLVWRDSDNTLRVGVDAEGAAISITGTNGGYLYWADENVTASTQRIQGGAASDFLLRQQVVGQDIRLQTDTAGDEIILDSGSNTLAFNGTTLTSSVSGLHVATVDGTFEVDGRGDGYGEIALRANGGYLGFKGNDGHYIGRWNWTDTVEVRFDTKQAIPFNLHVDADGANRTWTYGTDGTTGFPSGVVLSPASQDFTVRGAAGQFMFLEGEVIMIRPTSNSAEAIRIGSVGNTSDYIVSIDTNQGYVNIGNLGGAPSEKLQVTDGNIRVQGGAGTILLLTDTTNTVARVHEIRTDNGSSPGNLTMDVHTRKLYRGTGAGTEILDWNTANTITASANILPNANSTRDLGSSALNWEDVFAESLQSAVAASIHSDTGGANHTWTFGTDGSLTIPAGGVITSGLDMTISAATDITMSAPSGNAVINAGGVDIDANGTDLTISATAANLILEQTNNASTITLATDASISINASGGDLNLNSGGTLNVTIADKIEATADYTEIIVTGGSPEDDATALLNLNTTTQGFLPPRLSTTQRDAISGPQAGLMIYNNTTNKLNFYNGTAWEAVVSA